ncbi:MAG: transketolase C-terminal domain-containing protein [Oscillospiraceae bacterium]|nr:transketolase C-terminal domain-containing protein [Oscillospiraceae bacterium]
MPVVKAKADRVKTGVHFMLGNYALVEGAISAGCNFFAGYPITPANEISERMSQRIPETGGNFVQGEDELCSIYACAGAALAGGKAMTATASAGFNYMQEGIGYCYAVEAPVVIANVQRCRGENYASQADVYQMRYGASGDYEAIVLCPSSVQELFDYAIWAFNLSEKYRNPVIIMSETTIALMRERLEIPDAGKLELYERRYTSLPPEQYLPFSAEPFGCPDAAPLAQGYRTIYSLNPHDARGDIDWDPEVFERLYRRVCGKIRENAKDICRTERFMMDDADEALIAYGSEVRPCIEAALAARENGRKVGVLKLCNVWPVPESEIREVAGNVGILYAVEMNNGKYVNEISRCAANACQVIPVTKNRGMIHTPAEICESLLRGGKGYGWQG